MNRKKLIFIMKKILVFLISILALSLIVFVIARLTPMDPLRAYFGERVDKMTTLQREHARSRLGLNDPLPVQYLLWLNNALRGNFGMSYQYKTDVLILLQERAGNTLLLGGIGFLLTFVLALILGVLSARYENSLPDRIMIRLGTLTSCIPEFYLALLLIFIFSVSLHLLPGSGAYTVGGAEQISDRLIHLILPLTTLVVSHLWYYACIIRNMMAEELRSDYVLLAGAKGLSVNAIIIRHCLRNIMPAYLHLMAVSIPHILGGTYIIETVFSYPGIGSLTYESARLGDYNLLMVICLLTGTLVIFFGMVSDGIGEAIRPDFHMTEPGFHSKEVEK